MKLMQVTRPMISIALLLIAILYLVTLGFSLSPESNDFKFYYEAALAMVQTGSPYTETNGYLYPPLLAYILQPVHLVTPTQAQQLWFLLNLLFCAGVYLLSMRSVADVQTRIMAYWAIALLGFVFFPPVQLTLQLGQISGLITLLLLLGISYAPRRPGIAGASFALATCLKLYPAYLILYYWRPQTRRVVLWSGGIAGVITVLTLARYGLHPYLDYLTQMRSGRLTPLEADFNISIVAFWYRLFTDNPYSIPIVHNPLLALMGSAITSIGVIGVCVTTHTSASSSIERHVQQSLWVCAMLLLSPVNGYYNLIAVFYSILVVWAQYQSSPKRSTVVWLSISLGLMWFPPTWTQPFPLLYQFTHTSWGILFLTPSFYGLGSLFLLLAVLSYSSGRTTAQRGLLR